jgi:hypothetical protein
VLAIHVRLGAYNICLALPHVRRASKVSYGFQVHAATVRQVVFKTLQVKLHASLVRLVAFPTRVLGFALSAHQANFLQLQILLSVLHVQLEPMLIVLR